MNLRPQPAAWVEVVVARDDLLYSMRALAHTQAVELQTTGQETSTTFIDELRALLNPVNALMAEHSDALPPPQPGMRPQGDLLGQTRQVVDKLMQWQQAAKPKLVQIHTLAAENRQLTTWLVLARQAVASGIELARLAQAGPVLETAFACFPAPIPESALPDVTLHLLFPNTQQAMGILLYPCAQHSSVAQQLASLKGKLLPVPADWRGSNATILTALTEQQNGILSALQRARDELQQVTALDAVARQLGWIIEMNWLLEQLPAIRLEAVTAYTTGWCALPQSNALNDVLERASVRGLARTLPPPRGAVAPMVLRNPWWAQPFEVFIRALGMPGPTEADPSILLAVIAPLIFGYMFGDAGQGMVLILLGALLQRRYPLARLLLPGGSMAILFGLLYGSFFSMRGVVPALWLDPLQSPLTILAVPLAGGFALLSVGLLLGAMEAWWQKRAAWWLQTRMGLLLAYWGAGWAFVRPSGAYLLIFGLLWHFAGNWHCRPGRRALIDAVSSLLEQGMQLAVNTLSFVRVGAFALAHAGLSMAIVSLAQPGSNRLLSILVLVIGNVFMIVLETMVVSIQTTRLILLEFFLRFAAVHGRRLMPLTLPAFILPGGKNNDTV